MRLFGAQVSRYVPGSAATRGRALTCSTGPRIETAKQATSCNRKCKKTVRESRQRRSAKCGRILRRRPRTRAQHPASNARGHPFRVPPDATESISYKIPAFHYNGPLLWYAAFSDHCSLFPTAAVIAAFKKDLRGYITFT
jgi:hypothetical protein